MDKLFVHGGQKTIKEPFPVYNPIGPNEIEAALDVLKSGVLSGFLGSWHEKFYGGPKVRELEEKWAAKYQMKHAVSFNSWTSGLMAAVGALNIEPGDEVIVSPWTMIASATAIIVWNAIPVFADIDNRTFNISVESIKKNINKNTRAIMVPDIFGQAAELEEIMAIAKENNLQVIEDAAQSPWAYRNNKLVGTFADIGGYSLNCHKHIHTGEGGIAVTDDDELAERMRLIRNHGDIVAEGASLERIDNIIGFNFRLGEIEAAIAIAELDQLEDFVESRSEAAQRLSSGLNELPGLMTPFVDPANTHNYYIYPLLIDKNITQVSRDELFAALLGEGVPALGKGYQLIHMAPMYTRKIAYGRKGFPWDSAFYDGNVSYGKGVCPNAEVSHEAIICLGLCQHYFTNNEVDQIIAAFQKVWRHFQLF